jgi:hypothetical protein
MLGRAQRRLRDHDIAVMGWRMTEVQVEQHGSRSAIPSAFRGARGYKRPPWKRAPPKEKQSASPS